jgi:hypothetical protein
MKREKMSSTIVSFQILQLQIKRKNYLYLLHCFSFLFSLSKNNMRYNNSFSNRPTLLDYYFYNSKQDTWKKSIAYFMRSNCSPVMVWFPLWQNICLAVNSFKVLFSVNVILLLMRKIIVIDIMTLYFSDTIVLDQ